LIRALVTGATGFIGSYLTERLVKAGEEVAILIRPGSDIWRIKDVLPNVTQIEGDLLTLSENESTIRQFNPDTVFHLAWYGVSNRYRNDYQQVERNLHSSLALFRLASRIGCRTWIGLGSQAEYGPQNKICDEDTDTNPTTWYGVAKISVYLLVRKLAAEDRARFVWLRLFSAYGPKDNSEWMIPYLIRTLLRGEKPSLTLGEQRWDYLYVEDAVEAIYQTALSKQSQGVYNLGSGEAHTIRNIVEHIRDLIDPALPLGFGEIPYLEDQVIHLQANITKLTEAIGWKPLTPFDVGLKQTVEWYRQRMEHGL
jgi:nucleoside-diphosphate-sugar epimerase